MSASVSAWTIRVYGIPKGCGRPRAAKVGGFVRVYDAGVDKDWKTCVREAAKLSGPKMLSGPVSVSVTYLMPRPKSLKRGERWHTKKPDRDNLDKSTLDALVQAGVLVDDNCVCDGRIRKEYAPPGVEPGAIIHVRIVDAKDLTLTGD